jgi:hypothetical protein
MSRPAKVPKAQAVARITELRKDGFTVSEISIRLGLSESRVGDYIKLFEIPLGSYRRKTCPHCGMDTKTHPV